MYIFIRLFSLTLANEIKIQIKLSLSIRSLRFIKDPCVLVECFCFSINSDYCFRLPSHFFFFSNSRGKKKRQARSDLFPFFFLRIDGTYHHHLHLIRIRERSIFYLVKRFFFSLSLSSFLSNVLVLLLLFDVSAC